MSRLLGVVALGASAFLLLVVGSASASAVVTCTGTVSDQAAVQTAIDGGGAVLLKGLCRGNWTIASPVVLAGTAGTVLDGNAAGSVLTVTNEATAIVMNLTIRNGAAGDGGGIFADADTNVTVKNTTIRNNTADDAGGGIYAQGFANVTILGGAIIHNASLNAGGGVATLAAYVSMSDVSITANTAAMGGGIAAQFSDVSLLRTRVMDNTASDFAGGIVSFASGSIDEFIVPDGGRATGRFAFSLGRFGRTELALQAAGPRATATIPDAFTIANSSIDHNTALGQGGGGIVNVSPGADTDMTITNSSVSFNTVPGQATIGAGGIANVGGSPEDTATLHLTGSRVIGNTAVGGLGGGIYNVSQSGATVLLITTSSISSSKALSDPNEAAFGGGIYQDGTVGPASTALNAAGVLHNRAGTDGGGVYNLCGTVTTAAGAAIALNTPNDRVDVCAP